VFRVSRAIFDDPEIFALAAGDALVEPGSAGINNPFASVKIRMPLIFV
jgi:hypothetical protein